MDDASLNWVTISVISPVILSIIVTLLCKYFNKFVIPAIYPLSSDGFVPVGTVCAKSIITTFTLLTQESYVFVMDSNGNTCL